MKIAILFVAVLTTVAALWLAYSWLFVGYGLHPAVVGALLAILWACVWAMLDALKSDPVSVDLCDCCGQMRF